MRRTRLLALSVALLTAVTGAAPATAAPAVRVSVDECGVVTAKRLTGVTFSAEMDYVEGAAAMAMRFELQTRLVGETAFTRAETPDESWFRSKAVKTYRVDGRTFVFPDLNSAAEYRARVTYRWTGPHGETLDVVRRTSAVCRLTPLPDLELGTLTTTAAAQPGLMQYSIPVRNRGRADAGTFDVALRIGGEDRPTVAVTGLASGGSQLVTFSAPRCAARDVVRLEADPDGRIAEDDERDNVLTVACPAA